MAVLMQFSRSFGSRTERFTANLVRRLPAFLKSPQLNYLEHAFENRTGKHDFMQFADSFQAQLFSDLLSRYRHETFSKLLALKITNLAVARYHHRHRHSILMSRPVQLTVDPTNVCQLGCPGCVHSSNEPYRELFDWPRKALAVDVHDRFLETMAPFAFATVLYSYGDPLLHRKFADFVRSSKKYLLSTLTSTNLSMPLDDPEDLVASGLDRIVVSIDGTTQDIYERYRRSGNLELVFENVRKLVTAKKRLGMRSPYLVWQFLTFEHNSHQVKEAIVMARELGVNEIVIDTPFGVEADDPSIHAVRVPDEGVHVIDPWDGSWCTSESKQALDRVASTIESEFDRSWEQRLEEAGPHNDEGSPRGSSTCDWLYQNVTLDGASRVMPCCMAPVKSTKNLVFANFDSGIDRDPEKIVNSRMAVSARLAFSDRSGYESRIAQLSEGQQPYCAECREKPAPYGLLHVAGDISLLDTLGVIPAPVREALTDWS
jgi:pyruvate-formate lyase-activating enzyme